MRKKKPSAGMNEHELERSKGHGCLASSSKGNPRKRDRKLVSCSNIYPDVVEIDRDEFLRDLQSRKSCDVSRGSNQNTRVPGACHTRSSYVTKENRLDHIDIEMGNSDFSVSLESRSFKDEGLNEHVLKKSKGRGCVWVASSSKGDNKKRSRKSVSGSKIYPDVVEIDISEFLRGIQPRNVESDQGKPPKEEEKAEKQSPPAEESFPLKFRFEDEFSPKEEKSEFELMVDGLFDEMEYALLQCTNMDSFNPPAVSVY